MMQQLLQPVTGLWPREVTFALIWPPIWATSASLGRVVGTLIGRWVARRRRARRGLRR